MKKILVLHTGGTIAMKENMLTGGVSPDVANPLLDAEITIPEHVELLVEDIFNLPSPLSKKCAIYIITLSSLCSQVYR